MNDIKTYKINPENENISVGVLIDRINKGYELQEIKRELTEEEVLHYNGSIILAPDYQREYRFTLQDEIKLVESLLVGIPIPPIFLATDRFNNVRVTNVVDGQHRLRALYRFYNNLFTLENLSLLDGLEGCTYKDLNVDLKAEFREITLIVTIFKDFPGVEFELEIFNRYNKGTKPLSQQEIRHAVYNSVFNEFINNFTIRLYTDTDEKNQLKIAYNITKDRIQKKKVQEGLFVILSILEYGINENYAKSLNYAEEYMKEKSEKEKNDRDNMAENFEYVKSVFDRFNNFIIRIQETCEFPFSKEIYGVSSRNYKFQISIAMILSGIFNKLVLKSPQIITSFLESDSFRDNVLNILKKELVNSFLEDPSYNASSTNSREIYKLVNDIVEDLNAIN